MSRCFHIALAALFACLAVFAAPALAKQARVHKGLGAPAALAALKGGAVAVLQKDSRRVVLITPDGKRTQLKGLVSPVGVAVDEMDELIVLDRRGGELAVVRFNGAKGSEPKMLDPEGQPLPENPAGIAASNRILWVVDKTPPRVMLYGYDGKPLAIEPLGELGVRLPVAIAIDHEGEVFVADALGPLVVRLGLSGVVTSVIELSGMGFTRPVAVAAGGGGLWVGDSITGIVGKIDYLAEQPEVELTQDGIEHLSGLAYGAGGIWYSELLRGRAALIKHSEGE